jgi:hypothetical protein
MVDTRSRSSQVSDGNAVMDPDATILWQIVRKDDTVLTLWPGTSVREKDRYAVVAVYLLQQWTRHLPARVSPGFS